MVCFASVDASHSSNFITRIRQLYERREVQVSPVPWHEDFSFHLKDLFTRLRIVEKEKTRGMLKDEITNMTGIFRKTKGCQNPRIVLIEGEPGMGKTTYCQKLAYDWATKQDNEWDESFPEIEVLLLLRCRDIKSSIWEATDEQILPDDFDKEAKDSVLQFIRENQSKVLLVLDGLDEADPSKLDMYLKLIQSKDLSECHIVLTSRHEAGKKVRKYCDALWEIVGFTEEDAKTLIRKYFQHKKHLAEVLISKLWHSNDYDNDYVNDYDNDYDYHELDLLSELTKNPLNTTLLCVLFEDFDGDLPNNKTQLYIEIVLCVLRRYEKKNGLSSNGGDLITVYKKDLTLLGRMALQSLCNGELHFEEHEGIFKGRPLIKFGFLSIQAGGSKRIPCIRCGFLHKSFQEFFAGLYLAFQILDREIDCASVVTDERYSKELSEVFFFMGGIVVSRSEEAAVSLLSSWVTDINYKSRTSSSYLGRVSLSLAFKCVAEWTINKEKVCAQLVDLLGKHLDLSSLTELRLSFDGSAAAVGAESLSQALAVNSSLTNLDLRLNSIGDTGAESLSQALTVNSSLTNLYLGGNSIGDTSAESLSQALAVNSSLTKLVLSWNSIGDTGVEFLSQALAVNVSLTNLNLCFNSIGATGAEFLSQALAVNSSLTNLDLRRNSIGDTGAESLSQALKVNSSLTWLDLTENSIGDTGAEFLSQALAVNSSLTNLDLRRNSIGDTGAESLSQALKVNSSLTWLDLTENSIGDTGAESLSQALKVNSSLTWLDLSENSIGDTGAESLSQALTVNSSLTNLYLGGNSIGDTGAESLSQALTVNSSLTNLNLSENGIGHTGAASLSQALAVNSSLTNLNLSGNSIGDTGAESLSQALTVNSSLTNLNLSENGIGHTGAASLSQALAVNSSLTNLNLSGNSIGDTGAASLSQALAVNSSLTKLVLSGYSKWIQYRCHEIGDIGAASLSQALTVNSSLTNLDLRGNSIGDIGAASLSQAVAVNSSLTNLDLSENSIGDTGAASLSQAVAVSASLTNLGLSGNRIGDTGAASLSQALKVNSSLTWLDLSENSIGDTGAASLSQALKVNSLTYVNLNFNNIDN